MEENPPDDELAIDEIEELLRNQISEVSKLTVANIITHADENLAEDRARSREFLDRLRARFSESFELAELFLSASTEIGHIINTEERPAAVERNDAKFEALIRNHARSCRVAREVFTLCVKDLFKDICGRPYR